MKHETKPVNPEQHPVKEESYKETVMQYLYKPDSDVTILQGMLKMQHAYTWMKDAMFAPIPGMLFDEFWREGELCMLFSDGDMDKSVLAVQIADSISRGIAAGPFKMQSKKQPVLYVDFELSAKQFEGRYSKDYKQHYQFHPNFIRVEMNPDFADDGQTSFEDNIVTSIEQAIEVSDAKILVIDNLTWLGENMGKANKARLLMGKLNALKVKYSLSILVLATANLKKTGKPITRADVQARTGLMFLCDSAFCIGESTTAPNRFYLKQLRCRATELVYTNDKVCVCEIKKESNFKQFEFLQYSTEQMELMNAKQQEQLSRYLEIMELKKQGKSNMEIAAIYGVTEGAVRLWLKSGQEKYDAVPGKVENLFGATNTTSDANTFPGGVINPFVAIPVKEDLEADSLNAEGVLNPSGMKSATNATSAANTFPGGVIDPFGAIPENVDLEAFLLNAEGVLNPSGVESATNTMSANRDILITEERELLTAAA